MHPRPANFLCKTTWWNMSIVQYDTNLEELEIFY